MAFTDPVYQHEIMSLAEAKSTTYIAESNKAFSSDWGNLSNSLAPLLGSVKKMLRLHGSYFDLMLLSC